MNNKHKRLFPFVKSIQVT